MSTTIKAQTTQLHNRCATKQCARPAFRSVPAPRRARRSPLCKSQAASSEQEVRDAVSEGKISQEEVDAARAAGEEIYIGFDKADTGPRQGRQGRTVRDDPSRYPDRDPLTGGWAGGELGLKQFVEEQAKQGTTGSKVSGKKEQGQKEQGQEAQPQIDPRLYPGKEDVGIFPGVTGGFAGGEKGVQQFVEKGEIKLDETGKREFSPIIVAALIAGGVTTGAILLNSGIVVSEEAFQAAQKNLEAVQSGAVGMTGSDGASGATFVIDDKTRLLLNAALGITGISTLLIGGRTFAKRVQENSSRLREDSLNIAKISVFWLAVLLATLFVLDSN